MKISFYKDDSKTEDDGIIYEEWMMGCMVKRMFTENNITYWLSRAYRSNQLFVYKYDFQRDKIFIDNLSVNVRLVRDEIDSEDVS